MQRCTVSWTTHATPINAINVSFPFNITPICVDIAATQATIPAVLAPFTNVTNSGITIIALGSTPINIAGTYSPFFVIHFRGEPSSTLTLNGTGFIRRHSDNIIFTVANTPKPVTFVSGFSISGLAKKLGGTPCSNGMNNRITGVIFTVNQVGGASCFPGSLPLSTSPAKTYSFTNLPMSFTYNVTAAKTAGCECGLEGPINNDDVNFARSYILGLAVPTLLQGHTADYNANGAVSSFDLVLMSQCYQGIPSVPSVWRFAAIDVAGTFSNPLIPGVNPLPALLPGSLNVPNLLSNKTVDFIGIKRGDVDQSCTECGSSLISDEIETRSKAAVSYTGLSFSDISLEQGAEMLVPVVATENLKGISVLSVEMLIGNQIELLDVQDALTGEYSNFTTRQQGRQNVLHYTWFTMKDGGEDVASSEVLLYVRIKALDKGWLLREIDVPDNAGIYQLTVLSPFGQQTVRLVKY